MRLGLIINEYRAKNGMSMDEFAKKSGLSKAYIGFLEKGVHPKTMNPIKPSVDAIKKCATAMGMDFSTLFNMLDEEITLEPAVVDYKYMLNEEDEMLIEMYHKASPDVRKAYLDLLKASIPPHKPSE